MRAGPVLGLAVISVTLMNYSLRGARGGVLGIARLRSLSMTGLTSPTRLMLACRPHAPAEGHQCDAEYQNQHQQEHLETAPCLRNCINNQETAAAGGQLQTDKVPSIQ